MRTQLTRHGPAPALNQDDAAALDLPTIKAWALILRLTVAEYLGLDPNASLANANDQRRRDRAELVSYPLPFLRPLPCCVAPPRH